MKKRGQFADKCLNADRHEENWCEQIYGWIEDVKPFLEIVRNKIFRLADQKMKSPIAMFDQLFDIVNEESSSNTSSNNESNSNGSTNKNGKNLAGYNANVPTNT